MEAVLHGRDAPLRVLRGALDSAIAGRGQLVTIEGAAGLGKSALAAALARDADLRATVTWGKAWEFADAPPYFPVWPCLRGLGITVAHDESQGFHLWEQVLEALAGLARPAVWIMEDLHAADLGTLDLLTYLAQPIRSLPVMIVATTRVEDARLTDRKQQRLTRMARDGAPIRLTPLADRDVAAITEDILGKPVPASAIGRIADLTAGNPLFVVECARAFRAAGGVEGTLGQLPPTIRQVIVERTELLPEATRQALACGAVLGREFSAATAARVTDSLPARVIDALLPALRAGVIRELRPGQFQFSHTLVRDAIEDALPAGERARLHGRAANALAALGDSADLLVDRARHALAAAQTAEPAEVLAIIARATELLEREGAHDRAFELAARVEEARAVGALPASTPLDKLRFAAIARAAGRSDAGRSSCEEVIALARAAGDGELFSRAVLLLASDIRPGVITRSQVALLEEARALLGNRSQALASRVLARLATALQPAEDDTPIHLARQALAEATASGDPSAVLDVLDLGAWGLYGAAADERVAWSTKLLEHASAAGDRARTLDAHVWRAFIELEAGAFDAFDRTVTAMLSLSDELGHPRYRWRPLLLASTRALSRGSFAEAERYLTEVSQLASLADDPAIAPALVMHEVSRAKVQGHPDAIATALDALDQVTRDLKQRDLVIATFRAGCAARSRDIVATRACIAQITAMPPDPMGVAMIAEAYAAVGTEEQRRRVSSVLESYGLAELYGGHVSFSYDGPLDRVLALLDASLGNLARAEERLRRAHALAVERGHLSWCALIAYELADVLRRAGRDTDARAFADESLRLARELDMPGLAGSAASVAAEAAPALVIEREADVWRVARGPTGIRVKDSRGMQLLARLVERPGEEVHVLALASDEGGSAPESTSGEQLDEKSIKAYRRRLAELDESLAAAEAAGNAKRAAAMDRERTALRQELTRALGIGGRARQAGSATERARINVQRRLKDAIARIREVDDTLGAFLESAVRTGTYCCFRP